MLPNIAYELAAALDAKGVPYPVVYGAPNPPPTVNAPSQIVIQRDRERGDTVEPPATHSHNPRMIYKRAIGALVHVYAKSTLDGAHVGDHERVADMIVDQCLVCMRMVANARIQPFRVTESRLLSAAELDERQITTWPGVVYQLRMQIDRGVTNADWAGEGAGEATFGSGSHGIGTTLDTSSGPDADTTLPGATTRIP